MNLIPRLFLRVSRKFQCVASTWRMFRLKCLDAPFLQEFSIGPNTQFQVPVHSPGRGSLKIGEGNNFGWRIAPKVGDGAIMLQARACDSQVQIGSRNAFSNNVTLIAMGGIQIGDGCQIGDQVVIYDCDFHEVDPSTRNQSVGPILPVIIGNNVWLGSKVMVLKGVTIGDHSIVAAMSVVTKSIPPRSLAAGNPAKILRTLE